MPPRIYKGSEYALNYPSARPYVYAGAAYISMELPVTEVVIAGSAGSLDIVFNNFLFNAVSTQDSLDLSLPVFNISLAGIGGSTGNLSIILPSQKAMFDSSSTDIDVSAFSVSAEGICYQLSNIVIDASALRISAAGTITGTIAITPPPDVPASDDDLARILSGNNYIVVNLKTKSHTTYRDGNNNAVAKTGEINFSSQQLKNVSDIYLHSRVSGDIEIVAKSGETKERTYPVTFENTTQPNLKNKKVKLAKGIRATNWQLTIVSPDSSHAEIGSMDVIVNESKRRV